MFYSNNHSKKGASLLMACCLAMGIFSCKKIDFSTTEIYPENAKVDVSFSNEAPQPALVSEGTIVKYGITGLKAKAAGSYKFYISQMEATVQEVTDTYISVRVPVNASSGSASIVFTDGQIYYGPAITVRGNTQIASEFYANIGANKALLGGSVSMATILGITPRPDGNYIIYGNFTQYGNAITNTNITKNIQVIDNTGKALALADQFVMGKNGLNGVVSNVKVLEDGKYLVSGFFSVYDTLDNVNGVARFLANRKLEVNSYTLANADPKNHPEDDTGVGNAINGGAPGSVLNTFIDGDDKYITVGNYNFYSSVYYPNSTVKSSQLDIITSIGLTKMDYLGNFDSSFNYNYATNKSYSGANGIVTSAIKLYGGQLVLGGSFTSYHGIAALRLACIDPATGMISNAFKGSTDGAVYSITYNEERERLVIVGNFKNYNGTPVNGVAVVKEDGSLDTESIIRPTLGGVTTYCAQLNDGRFIISGSFLKYNGIIRPGFAILNEDGTLAAGYNNTGMFRGRIYGYAEADVYNGKVIYLVGNFDRFDNKEVGNIVKIILNNN